MSSDDETVIAFYGTRLSPERLAAFYRSAIDSFVKLGYPPSNALISRKDAKGRYTTFEAADAKLAKGGFGDVTAIELSAAKRETEYSYTDHFVFAFLNARRTVVHFSALSSILALSPISLLPLAEAFIQILQPAYGIGYKMARDQGPTLYAIGIGYSKSIDDAIAKRSGKAGEEALNVSRWGHTYMPARVWEWGFLRDVYPWNFLGKPQLAKQVGNVSLEQWIGQHESRGTLTPLSDGMTLWEVKDDNIPRVRATLLDGGLIFEWNRHRRLVGG